MVRKMDRSNGRMSAAQEDAWFLLNEVVARVKLLERVEKDLHPEDDSEHAYKVRHTLLAHQPAWMAKGNTPSAFQEKGPAVDGSTP
jgi:hypothetical protein